ncbi:MarR family winged helix-turn-helix transcriptional regulator [Agrobacterium sp. ES01]|uniref:MarR family winged helix-turn-helix transcriptional regulator n=1 Tax=Agrobacterium sp. ES01 TaxID=3420714 RepID=UPI003D098807
MEMTVRRSERVKVGALSGSLGFLLRLAQLHAFEEFFSDRGPQNLKPGDFSVLWVIKLNPGIRQSALGETLMIKRAHMTKLIRAQEERGLVSRRIPDDDRRAIELTLTQAGDVEVERAAGLFFQYEDTTGAPLTKREREQLVSLLHKYLGLEEASK